MKSRIDEKTAFASGPRTREAMGQELDWLIGEHAAVLRMFESVFDAAAELASQGGDVRVLHGAWEGLGVVAGRYYEEIEKVRDQVSLLAKDGGAQ